MRVKTSKSISRRSSVFVMLVNFLLVLESYQENVSNLVLYISFKSSFPVIRL